MHPTSMKGYTKTQKEKARRLYLYLNLLFLIFVTALKYKQ